MQLKEKILRIALPNKGRLAEPSVKLLKDAGFCFENGENRLSAKCSDFPLEILFVRAEDIPAYVGDGTADLGITGLDLVREKRFACPPLLELGFGKCRLALAAPKNSPEGLEWLDGKRVATSFPVLAEEFLLETGVNAKIVPLKGSVELAPRLGVADAIVDLVSSGNTLESNGLEERAPLLESQAVLIGPKELGEVEESVVLSIKSVLAGRGRKLVVANIPESSLDVLKDVPALAGPTIAAIYGKTGMLSVQTVVSSGKISSTVQLLKKAGATGILVTPIERLVE